MELNIDASTSKDLQHPFPDAVLQDASNGTTYPKRANKSYNKANSIRLEDVEESVKFMVKHINLIENQNSIKWLLNRGLNDIHNNVKQLYSKMVCLKSKVDEYKIIALDKNKDLKVAIESIQQKENDLKKESELRRTIENDRENSDKQLRFRLDSVNKLHSDCQAKCDSMSQDNDAYGKEIIVLRSQVEKLSTDYSDLQAKYETEKNDLKKSQEQLVAAKGLNFGNEALLKLANKRRQKSDKDLKVANNTIHYLKRESELRRTIENDHEYSGKQLRFRLDSVNESHSDSQAKCDSMSKDNEAYGKEIIVLRSQVEKLSTDYSDLQAKYETEKNDLKKSQEQLAAVKGLNFGNETLLNFANKRLLKSDKDLKVAIETIHGLKKESELRRTIENDHECSGKQLRNRFMDYVNKLYSDKQAKCDSMSKDNDPYGKEIMVLRSQVEELSTNYSDLQAKYETEKYELKKSQEQLENVKDLCSGDDNLLKSTNNRLHAENLNLHQKVTSLQNEINVKLQSCQSCEVLRLRSLDLHKKFTSLQNETKTKLSEKTDKQTQVNISTCESKDIQQKRSNLESRSMPHTPTTNSKNNTDISTFYKNGILYYIYIYIYI